MSDRTFCWQFVWIAACFGWFVRVVDVRFGELPALFMATLGGGLLIMMLERRIGKGRS